MPLDDGFQELHLGSGDVEDRLSRLGIREEDYTIDRVPEVKGNADLRLVLESPDARPLTGTGIDDDEGPLRLIQFHAVGRDDLDQGIVDRALERPAVGDDLPLEGQKRRIALPDLLEVDVPAFAQDVPEQHRSLSCVGHVGGPGLPGILRRNPGGKLRFDDGLLHVAQQTLLCLEHPCCVEPPDFPHDLEKGCRLIRLLIFHEFPCP